MTPPTRWRLLAGGGLAGVLLAAVMMGRDDPPNGRTAASSARASNPAASGGEMPVADVKLELLEGARAELGDTERNLFRFQPRPAPAAPPRPRAAPTAPAPGAPPITPPAGPPPLAPIPLRFIGLVDAPTQAGRLAILSDGRGNVFHGKEGDIIEGRYKVLQVSADAAELSYLDGRGRQTIRLSGQ